MALKIIIVLLVLCFAAIVAHLLVFNVSPTKVFIKKASTAKKGYDTVFRDLLSSKIDTTDTPKEISYAGVTIRYYSYANLSDSVMKIVEDAIRSYRDMETIYQNTDTTRQIYSTLVDIKLEIEQLRQKYCEAK